MGSQFQGSLRFSCPIFLIYRLNPLISKLNDNLKNKIIMSYVKKNFSVLQESESELLEQIKIHTTGKIHENVSLKNKVFDLLNIKSDLINKLKKKKNDGKFSIQENEEDIKMLEISV